MSRSPPPHLRLDASAGQMNDAPLFSKLDADRILRRAAEIEGLEDPQRLTLKELRSVADEAGFSPQALERAIAEARGVATGGTGRAAPVQKWGLVVTHLSTLRQLPIDISSEQLMAAVRLFQPYRDGPAHVKLEEHEITWRDRRGLRFAVTSSSRLTEIRVFVSKPMLRRGRWMAWVKAAADRLEMLVSLVASGDEQAASPSRARLAPSGTGVRAASGNARPER